MKRMVIFIFVLLLLGSCGEQRKQHAADEHVKATATYTCPMHPQIVQDKPGDCPVCGMALVESTVSGSNDLMLNETQMRLANITTQKVGKRPIGETVIVNGILVVDEERTNVISSRATGRIEKLFVKETGQPVVKGQPLYVLYSETLLTLQQEYLLAKDQYELLGRAEERYKTFLEASVRKLLRYGMTQEQIGRLHGKSIQPRITFLSPASGIVKKVAATEGQYVDEGSLLYNIEDVSSLWVEAELYPNESAFVNQGDRVTVNLSGVESSPREAVVTFLSPQFTSGTQILIMRASIENRDMKLKPGQQVQVKLTHSSREGISVPTDAVIRDGKGNHVYVLSGPNTFQPRLVKTGLEGGDQVEIIEGLAEQDTVAITGAYLLYSEYVLKKGYNIATQHQHSNNN